VEELRAQREITRPNETKAAMDFEVLFQPKANGLNGAFLFFFDLRGCPGQLARTTTNPTAH
jgi:hypothetical protein